MTATIPEDKVKEYVNDQIEEVIREALIIVLAETVDDVVQKVRSKPDFDPEEEKIDLEQVAAEKVISAMFGGDTSEDNSEGRSNTSEGRAVEIPVAGRINEGASTEITLKEYETPTKTIELPIEGGDVEDPDTMEWEVPDPEPRDPDEDPLEDFHRNNTLQDDEEDDEYNPADIPEAGLPFYQ